MRRWLQHNMYARVQHVCRIIYIYLYIYITYVYAVRFRIVRVYFIIYRLCDYDGRTRTECYDDVCGRVCAFYFCVRRDRTWEFGFRWECFSTNRSTYKRSAGQSSSYERYRVCKPNRPALVGQMRYGNVCGAINPPRARQSRVSSRVYIIGTHK